MMNPLTRSAYAADVRHLVQFFGIDGVLECDTPAEWARIEHALTARDSHTPDEAMALRIVRALLNDESEQQPS